VLVDQLLIAAATVVVHAREHPHVSAGHLHTLRHHTAKAHTRHYIHILGLRLSPHIRPQGPPLDYVALFLFAALSGIGVNGFGEVALLGAGVYVSNHHLPIEPVLLIAWLGASAGGIVGWAVGRHAGRRLLTAPGPLFRFRTKMLEHSESVYYLHPSVAVVLTPSWAAGIEKIPWRPYLSLNAISALIWALPIGLGAYFLGPRITTEFSDEIGWVVAGLVLLFFIYAGLQRLLRTPSHRPE
jgi:membrane protein DedA with SNARE-associated domain